MGTRCLTIIHDNGVPLISMNRQFDGYLSGHGSDLADFLDDITMVNGLPPETEGVANGAGCLAAQMIAHFKTEPGGIYIVPTPETEENMEDIDFIYNVIVNGLTITIEAIGGDDDFNGTVEEFIAYCNKG